MELKFRAWDKRFKKFDYGQGSLLLRHNSDDYEKVQQYIGLKDKNGKEIYRGDIVKTKDGKLFEVVYNKEYARYQLGNKRTIMPLDCLEVVGNIYENKELLK